MTPVGGGGWDQNAWEPGYGGPKLDVLFNRAGPGYFRTMGIPFVAGRDFDPHDDLAAPKVAIVNEQFARKIFQGKNPIGRTFRREEFGDTPDSQFLVVGLVRNTKYYELREDFQPIAYVPEAQNKQPGTGATFVLRTNAPLGEFYHNATAAAAEIHPEIGVDFTVLTAQIQNSLMRDRLMAALAGAFGLLAGVLAVLGLYGVIAYMVAHRRNEIGVRIALGATRARVVGLVLREATLLLALGLTIGARFRRLGRPHRSLPRLRHEARRSLDAGCRRRPPRRGRARRQLRSRLPRLPPPTYGRPPRRVSELSTPLHTFGLVFQGNRSLTVAAPIPPRAPGKESRRQTEAYRRSS